MRKLLIIELFPLIKNDEVRISSFAKLDEIMDLDSIPSLPADITAGYYGP
jgi:hypothetical protein